MGHVSHWRPWRASCQRHFSRSVYLHARTCERTRTHARTHTCVHRVTETVGLIHAQESDTDRQTDNTVAKPYTRTCSCMLTRSRSICTPPSHVTAHACGHAGPLGIAEEPHIIPLTKVDAQHVVFRTSQGYLGSAQSQTGQPDAPWQPSGYAQYVSDRHSSITVSS